jgi:hypothetical protein
MEAGAYRRYEEGATDLPPGSQTSRRSFREAGEATRTRSSVKPIPGWRPPSRADRGNPTPPAAPDPGERARHASPPLQAYPWAVSPTWLPANSDVHRTGESGRCVAPTSDSIINVKPKPVTTAFRIKSPKHILYGITAMFCQEIPP